MRRLGTAVAAAMAAVMAAALSACTSVPAADPSTPSRTVGPTTGVRVMSTTPAAAPPTTAAPTLASAPSPRASTASATRPAVTSAAPPRTAYRRAASAPVIVVDPGHSVTVHATDPRTGLDVSDYANEPEMRDVWSVALLVRTALTRAGYRVVLTKPTLDTPTSLGARAAVADRVHAALALSIHDQAGADGGIGFTKGNNTVYYQSVGDYRDTRSGRRIRFTDAAVAATSRRYAAVFAQHRAKAQGATVRTLGNTGYDLGGRGLPSGNIWLVQLLSHVPWIYNEAGGNSAGRVGLSATDRQRYADGLVAAVRACVPVR